MVGLGVGIPDFPGLLPHCHKMAAAVPASYADITVIREEERMHSCSSLLLREKSPTEVYR